MATNERIGVYGWLVTLLLGVGGTALLRRRQQPWRKLWLLPLLAVVHPGWWMSSRSGDCGYMLRDGSFCVTALAILVMALLWWPLRHKTQDTADGGANS